MRGDTYFRKFSFFFILNDFINLYCQARSNISINIGTSSDKNKIFKKNKSELNDTRNKRHRK